MLKLAEYSSPLTQMNILALSTEIRAPMLARAIQFYARRCEASARAQGLSDDQFDAPGVFALLGLTEDGSVIAMHKQHKSWHISRASVPSALVPILGATLLTSDNSQPLWVRLLPNYVGVFKRGKDVPIWDARRPPMRGATKALREPIGAGPEI